MKVYTQIAQMVLTGKVRIRTQTQNADGSWGDVVDVHLDRATLDRVLDGQVRFEAMAEVSADGTASLESWQTN